MGSKAVTTATDKRLSHAQQKHAQQTHALVKTKPPGPLLSVEKARQFLAHCISVDEVRDVADKAKAVKNYLRTRKASIESQNDACEIQLRAQRRLGELTKEIEKASPPGRAGSKAATAGKTQTLEEQGISRQNTSKWQTLAAIPEKKFEALVADARERCERITESAVTQAAKVEKQATARAQKEAAAKIAPERACLINQDAWHFIEQLDDQSVDLLLTDPPYSTDVDVSTFASWLASALPKIKTTGRAYVCIGAYPLELLTYLELLRNEGWIERSQVLVWTYRNTLGPSPTHDYKLNWQAILYLRGVDAAPLDCDRLVEQFSVQDINAPDGRLGDRYHAWQKPDDLAERFVRHASKPGDLVVDPFACTGTFLIAAAALGRRAIGCDISDDNLKIAEQRGCLRTDAKEAAA